METLEKVIIGGMMAIVMVAMIAQVLQGFAPTPKAKEFLCPYCNQSFATLDELVNHVATDHPDQPPIQPIDVIWG